MTQVEASTVIDRPVEAVFAFVADLENNPRWESNFLEVRRLSGEPSGVGAAYECVLRLPGQRVTSRIEVTELVPNRRISFRGDRPASARPVGSITFEPAGAGTRVTTLPRPQFRGPLRLLAPLMAGSIRRSNERHLANLKALLEAD
jgi:uncharacterized protein YndB with AHSA1/START domain